VGVTCEKFANLPLLLELISDKLFVAYIFVRSIWVVQEQGAIILLQSMDAVFPCLLSFVLLRQMPVMQQHFCNYTHIVLRVSNCSAVMFCKVNLRFIPFDISCSDL